MKLPELTIGKSLKSKRVLVRVDWNIPLTGELAGLDSLKLERTFPLIKDLSKHGAVVILMTHLGRPKKQEKKYSTKNLIDIVKKQSGIRLRFLDKKLDDPKGLSQAKKLIKVAKPSTIFLLENVRFNKGETENDPKLAKVYSELGSLFVNDAFASCHREHASVVGITKLLPSYAGPSLMAEVEALSKLLKKPKKPFVAVIGGAKLSSKIGALESLLKIADKVMVGGAMAHVFFAAKKMSIGKSMIEEEAIPLAKKLIKHQKLLLPIDVVVAKKLNEKTKARVVRVEDIKKTDVIGDIGTGTMLAWSQIIRKAQTIVWNGPVGVTEIPTFSNGSKVLNQAIAVRSRGPAYGVVGGGDTLPVVMQSGMGKWIDHLSTGGGAMLEFIANKGKLPGLQALTKELKN